MDAANTIKIICQSGATSKLLNYLNCFKYLVEEKNLLFQSIYYVMANTRYEKMTALAKWKGLTYVIKLFIYT
jgi:hypothetical protein